jgi:hypothetical protein
MTSIPDKAVWALAAYFTQRPPDGTSAHDHAENVLAIACNPALGMDRLLSARDVVEWLRRNVSVTASREFFADFGEARDAD